MSKSVENGSPPGNLLLAALPKKEFRLLLPDLTKVNVAFGEVLYDLGDTITHVYFPNDCLISLLSAVADRLTLEVGMVGNEGMAGLSVFMGITKASNRALVQGGGTAFEMKSSTLRKISSNQGSLHSLLHRYTHSLLTQVSQSSVCNRFHNADARLARWLLMTCDRMGSNNFRMTQQFLAHMIGVRREAVNKSLGSLQARKLISYSRGEISILNRARLEKVSCTCYRIIKESDSFLN